MSPTVLILGANGRFGRNAATAFQAAGWQVRRFDRNADRLTEAARGAEVIVNGWNPPYTAWAAELPGQTRGITEAARASGSTVLLPGNVYVYGSDAPADFTRKTPHHARNPLGRLRIEMEAAYRASGVPTILLRAGDFIDDRPSGNWFDRVIARDARKGRLSYPGDPDAPHAWAYLPDLARAAVGLAAKRSELASFEEVLFPGYTLTGWELADATATALGRPVRLRRMSWLPIRLARPFWPMARHLVEMSYLWSMPHRIADPQIDGLLPDRSETPVVDALRSALQHQIHPDKPVT